MNLGAIWVYLLSSDLENPSHDLETPPKLSHDKLNLRNHKKSLNWTISSLILLHLSTVVHFILNYFVFYLCHGKSRSVLVIFSKWPVLISLTKGWKSFHRFGLPSDYLETVWSSSFQMTEGIPVQLNTFLSLTLTHE